ncbi:MAG: LysM peptidoglycan-binding domain-containing protein, partial [Thermocrispum sp.]
MRRTSQLLKGLAALAATATLTAGIPAGLVHYVGWPLPTRLPTFDEILLALRSGIDPQLLINTLAVIVWVAWAQLIVALTYEVVAAVRGRVARRAPVMPVIQVTAARLVATITLAAATLAPVRPDAAIADPLPAVTVQATWHHHPSTVSHPLLDPSEPPGIAEQETGPQPVYLVQRFDSLWGIAETTLGDGRRWREIRDLNLGRPTSIGKTITTATDHVPAGTSLLLPTDATLDPYQDLEEQTTPAEVTVESGGHFWKIAEQTLHDAWGRPPTSAEITFYWRKLIDVNRDRLAPPHDPNLIYPGQVFRLPPIPAPNSGAPISSTEDDLDLGADEVTVEPGDNFWRIAEQTLQEAWGRQPTTAE